MSAGTAARTAAAVAAEPIEGLEAAAAQPSGRLVRLPERLRWATRAPRPRASTAVAVVVGAFVAFFPGHLPHGPVLQGATTALFVLVAVGIARRLRCGAQVLHGPAHRLVLAGCTAALAATVVWSEVTQNAMRADVGWGPAGPGYWALLSATLAAVVVLVLGPCWLWRRRRALARRLCRRLRPLWRPAVAIAVASAVLLPAATVQGASAAPASAVAEAVAPRSDQVLQRPSPAGAVRVYAGLRDGEDVTARADRAADELVSAGGLQKSRVVLVVPTGSGWVDENAVHGLEARFHGDVATVALQYAHVPSWVAYLFDRDGAEQAARALFRAVQRRIEALPREQRPDLHVYGESLGATAGQAIFADGPSARVARRTVCSVLWVGSPGGATVGLPRETSVANDDDPIVHTSPALLYADPGDGRPWLPVVSLLQAGVDFVGSLAMPDGSGHRYGPGQVRRLTTCQ